MHTLPVSDEAVAGDSWEIHGRSAAPGSDGRIGSAWLPLKLGSSALHRGLSLVVLLALLVGGSQPAFAGMDWCSSDPLFAFGRTDSLAIHALDVQVDVRMDLSLRTRPLTKPLTLRAYTPSNVNGTVVINTPHLLYQVNPAVFPTQSPVTSDRYRVTLLLYLPSQPHVDKVRMVVTDPTLDMRVIRVIDGTYRVDPLTGRVIVLGDPGKSIRLTVELR